MEFRDVSPLLRPRGIAVVGASQRFNRGTRVVENLQRFGYSGAIVVVNPKYSEVAGVPCVPSIADLPDGIDLVVVAVGADAVPGVVDEAGRRGVAGAVVIGSGFGEGGAGVERARRLAEIVDAHGMVLCGPNCYGVLDAQSGTAAYSGRIVDPLDTGGVALVLQSGALTHAITDSALGRGLGVGAIVTSGNELSATVSDYVRFYADDPGTQVIGVFVEGLRDAGAFAAACRIARANAKPVVVLSTGRSEIGKTAAMAHTGAIAGGSAAFDGLIDSVGAVRVDDIDEFRETLMLFSRLQTPAEAGRGLAALSISGGASGLMADMAETLGIRLATFAPDTRDALRDALPEFAAVNNPLDVTGAASENPRHLSDSLVLAAEDEDVAVVAFAMNVGLADEHQAGFYRGQAEIVAEAARSSKKPLALVTVSSGPLDQTIRQIMDEAGVPVVMGLRPGMKALGSWLRWLSLLPSETRPVAAAVPWPFATSVASGTDAMEALSAAGLPVAPFGYAADADSAAELLAEVGAPAVLKVESADILHKSDLGGVRLGLTSPEQVVQAAQEMLAAVSAGVPDATVSGFMVQQMMQGEKLEVLVGVVRDPQVGMVVSVAPGGVLAELSGPAASRPVPVTRSDAEQLISAGVLDTLLGGYRGSAELDRGALVDAVLAVSDLAATLPDLAALEINPLLVRPAGRGVVAVDALFVRES